jgi:hypothetical protein
MSDYTPIYQPGVAWSSTASATITGGQVLEVSGSGTVGPAAVGSTKVVGVAAFDAAANSLVTVHRGGVQELTAAATITAGQTLKAAAAGQVTPWVSGTDLTDLVVGTALTGAASAAKVQVYFLR